MKHKARQFEIKWTEPEDFRLEIQNALDGELMQKKADQGLKEKSEVDQESLKGI